MKRIAALIGLTALAAATPALAADDRGATERTISFDYSRGGQAVAASSVRLALGAAPTILSVSGRYRVSVAAEQAEDNRYVVRWQLFDPEGAGWRLIGSPTLIVEGDSEGRIEIDRPNIERLSMTFRVN